MKRIIIYILGLLCVAPSFAQQLYPIKKGKYYGYGDARGTILIEPQYSAVGNFRGDYTWVNKDGKAKKELAPIKGKWGVVDRTGKEVVPVQYDFVDFCQHGYVAVNIGAKMDNNWIVGGKWGLVNINTGKEVISPQYDLISPVYASGVAWGFKGTGLTKKYMRYIDADEDKTETRLFDVYQIFDVADMYDGKVTSGGWDLITPEGNALTNQQFERVGAFSQGYARVCKNGKWGVITSEGKITIDCKYDDVSSYQRGGLFWVKAKNRYQLMTKDGELLMNERFTKTSNFNKYGLAWVSRDSLYFLIDTNGVALTEAKYREASEFYNGVASLYSRDGYGYINYKGKIIAEDIYSGGQPEFGKWFIMFENKGKPVGFYVLGNMLQFYWIDSDGNPITTTNKCGFSVANKIPNELWDY